MMCVMIKNGWVYKSGWGDYMLRSEDHARRGRFVKIL